MAAIGIAMRLRIFSCHHQKPQFLLDTPVFRTLVSNVPASADGGFLSDLDGDNMAGDSLLSEMRHQFYVWKNLRHAYDYVGFEHYRRPFFIDPLAAGQLAAFPAALALRREMAGTTWRMARCGTDAMGVYFAMRRSLDAAAMDGLRAWIGSHDLLVMMPDHTQIQRHWESGHDPSWWPVIEQAVRRSAYFAERPCHVDFGLHRCHWLNSYIMRMDLFAEYMAFCFDALEYCRRNLPRLPPRALGYVAERLFNFWLYQKRMESGLLRVRELPFLLHDTSLDG